MKKHFVFIALLLFSCTVFASVKPAKTFLKVDIPYQENVISASVELKADINPILLKSEIKSNVLPPSCTYVDGARIVFQSGLIVVCNGCSNTSQSDATNQVDLCLLRHAGAME